MNIDNLRKLIKDKKLWVKETTKNIICICPYCGDHKDDRKKGHLYVSKNPEIPVVHCFIGGCAKGLVQFIEDISGSRVAADLIISKEEVNKAKKKSKSEGAVQKNQDVYDIPKLDIKPFPMKVSHIKKRTNGNLTPEQVPNLIFDFQTFFSMNNLGSVVENEVGEFLTTLQRQYVGYLVENQSYIVCRNIDPKSEFKHRKIRERNFGLLDYYKVDGGNPDSDKIVLAEGVYDVLGEYSANSLKYKGNVRLYASGQSYSYASLLKAVLFDECLCKADVVILSDSNISTPFYRKLLTNYKHVIKNLKVFYNKNKGGDFGSFPLAPVELRVQPYKKWNGSTNKQYRR